MFEIAKGHPDRPIAVKEISERQEVTVHYLEQILGTLRRSGIIRSVRGPGGGYLLSEDPEKVSVGDILRELEGPVAITSCMDPEEGCSRVDSCVTHMLWRSLGEKIEGFLSTITLADLMRDEGLLKRQVAKDGKSAPLKFRKAAGAGGRR